MAWFSSVVWCLYSSLHRARVRQLMCMQCFDSFPAFHRHSLAGRFRHRLALRSQIVMALLLLVGSAPLSRKLTLRAENHGSARAVLPRPPWFLDRLRDHDGIGLLSALPGRARDLSNTVLCSAFVMV